MRIRSAFGADATAERAAALARSTMRPDDPTITEILATLADQFALAERAKIATPGIDVAKTRAKLAELRGR